MANRYQKCNHPRSDWNPGDWSVNHHPNLWFLQARLRGFLPSGKLTWQWEKTAHFLKLEIHLLKGGIRVNFPVATVRFTGAYLSFEPRLNVFH